MKQRIYPLPYEIFTFPFPELTEDFLKSDPTISVRTEPKTQKVVN